MSKIILTMGFLFCLGLGSVQAQNGNQTACSKALKDMGKSFVELGKELERAGLNTPDLAFARENDQVLRDALKTRSVAEITCKHEGAREALQDL